MYGEMSNDRRTSFVVLQNATRLHQRREDSLARQMDGRRCSDRIVPTASTQPCELQLIPKLFQAS